MVVERPGLRQLGRGSAAGLRYTVGIASDDVRSLVLRTGDAITKTVPLESSRFFVVAVRQQDPEIRAIPADAAGVESPSAALVL